MTAAAVFLALGTFALCRTAEAGQIAFDRDLTGDNAYTGQYNGGEFKVTTYDGPLGVYGANVNLGGLFQTFCLERNERLLFDGTIYDYVVNTAAVLGGLSGGSPDPLSYESAYLYYHFARGNLSDYHYNSPEAGHPRTDSATSLQLAFWYLEGELGGALLTNAYNADAQAQAWVAEAQGAGWTEYHGVRVLNIVTTQTRENRQDVLVLTAAPLPAAGLLGLGLLSGLGALEYVRRRNRRTVV
jgi:hypothetical protein